MSEFLASLIVRSAEPAADIRPRLASRFEPIGRVNPPPPGGFDAHDLAGAGWDIGRVEIASTARAARRKTAPPVDTSAHQVESETDDDAQEQTSHRILTSPQPRRSATPETREPRTAAVTLDLEPVPGERAAPRPAPAVEKTVQHVERGRAPAPLSEPSTGSRVAPSTSVLPRSKVAPDTLEPTEVEMEAASPPRRKRQAAPADVSPVHREETAGQTSAPRTPTHSQSGIAEVLPALIQAHQPATARLKPPPVAAAIVPLPARPANPTHDAPSQLVPVRARSSVPVAAPALPIPQPAPLFRQAAQSPPSETEINVTIGRVEVRAAANTAPAPRSSRGQAAAPSLSLDDYLLQRARGGRS
jgi:hypothetical protein